MLSNNGKKKNPLSKVVEKNELRFREMRRRLSNFNPLNVLYTRIISDTYTYLIQNKTVPIYEFHSQLYIMMIFIVVGFCNYRGSCGSLVRFLRKGGVPWTRRISSGIHNMHAFYEKNYLGCHRHAQSRIPHPVEYLQRKRKCI